MLAESASKAYNESKGENKKNKGENACDTHVFQVTGAQCARGHQKEVWGVTIKIQKYNLARNDFNSASKGNSQSKSRQAIQKATGTY